MKMFSKLLPPSSLLARIIQRSLPKIKNTNTRGIGGMIPTTQYDTKPSKRFNLFYVIKKHWEIIPLFGTISAALGILFTSILWALNHKVDAVFTTHNRQNISRTMDLMKPTTHKIITINQVYEPWPEMAKIQRDMKDQEKKVARTMHHQ